MNETQRINDLIVCTSDTIDKIIGIDSGNWIPEYRFQTSEYYLNQLDREVNNYLSYNYHYGNETMLDSDERDLYDWISDKLKASNLKNSPSNFVYYGETPLGDTHAIVHSIAPNIATMLDDSSWEVWTKELDRVDPDSEYYTIERFSSWLTPTEHIMIQLIDESGKPTEVSRLAYELVKRLENYPILDESDYSEREYNASLESIRDYARYSSDIDSDTLPEDYVYLVWRELDDSNIYAEEGYFSDSDLYDAFYELGFITEDSEEDSDQLDSLQCR